MPSNPIITFQGLQTSPNQLGVKEGGLVEADNCVIRRDNVIEPRRGFPLYGESFGSGTDRAKQVFVYKDRILRHYGTTLQYDTNVLNTFTQESIFNTFSGSYSEVDTGLRIKSLEANGNFYFTTADGIKKISAATASDLSTSVNYITNAGGIKAVDFSASLSNTQGDQSGFLPTDSKVAYRIVYATIDKNNNKIKGTPSEREEISFSLLGALVRDFDTVLNALDNVSIQSGSVINDNNYMQTLGLTSSASASTLRTNLLSLSTKLDQEQGTLFTTANVTSASVTSNVCTITIAANVGIFGKVAVGDKIYLAGTWTGFGNEDLSGVRTVTSVTATTILFSVTATNGAVTLSGESIESGWFRGITQPGIPSADATNAQLIVIQDYLSDIITELQSSNNLRQIIDNDGSATSFPAELNSVTLTGAVAQVNVLAPADARDIAVNTDLIYLSGTFTPVAGTITGVQTINGTAITVTTFEFASVATGAVTLAADSRIDRLLRFTDTTQSTYIDTLNLTTSSNVILDITLPPDVTTDYLVQAYRTQIFSATDTTSLVDVVTDDEMRLVYEAYLTIADIAAQEVLITDVTPDLFRGANLYTNEISGEGIAQANDLPPKCKDVALYKNYTFYANTQTQYKLALNLLGVSDLISEYTAGRTPKVTIATEDGLNSNTYSFIVGVKESTVVTCNTTLNSSGTASYWLLYNANDKTSYYVWYQLGTSTDPAVAGKTGIQVTLPSGPTAAQVAQRTANVLASYIADFTTVYTSGATFTVTNVDYGYTTDASVGTTTFGFAITQGTGENSVNKEVLISGSPSVGTAVEETSKSFVRVVNENTSEIVSAYYISNPDDIPGKMSFQTRSYSTDKVYMVANYGTMGVQIGDSFSPALTPTNQITANTLANPTVVTSTAHGLNNNDKIIISGSNSTPIIDGIYDISYISANTFSIDVNVTIAGTTGGWTKLTDSINVVASDNEVRPNRLYYSKFSEPEAVPLLNYLDLGAQDQVIHRILTLRDSLFVFKEDGLFRVSAEIAPFSQTLFDNNVILIATDSLGITNNFGYAWTTRGIMEISEAGARVVSRDIDTDLFFKASTQFPNFSSITWGIGYDSDNTYLAFTSSTPADVNAEMAYVYNTLTRTWTTYSLNATCGTVNKADDKLYLGSGDTNYLLKERKDFARTDYAERQYNATLTLGNYQNSGLSIVLSSVTNFNVDDVLVQEQKITISDFNALLLKLDLDPGINDTNYSSILALSNGGNLRTQLDALATKLDADLGVSDTDYLTSINSKTGSITSHTAANPTVITSASHGLKTGRIITISGNTSTPDLDGVYAVTVVDANNFSIPVSATVITATGTWATNDENFTDIQVCYNFIISKLNSDTGVAFSNYLTSSNTQIQEVKIEAINTITKTLTVSQALPFLVGPLIVYNKITSTFTTTPIHFGDPVNWKHLRDAQLYFQDLNFSKGIFSFKSDLIPSFDNTTIEGSGPGLFGLSPFGSGFFGGVTNTRPFRTYIPRNKMRCRYLQAKFTHSEAREKYSCFGLSITGNVSLGERAYK